ncbi:Lon protease C-terminal proteolytic domain-containing protein [Zopfochytrium polystomum]|nr:Lon protease C-terminal proteolytic domain-containing protein [Zopfochytrium polystomum]
MMLLRPSSSSLASRGSRRALAAATTSAAAAAAAAAAATSACCWSSPSPSHTLPSSSCRAASSSAAPSSSSHPSSSFATTSPSFTATTASSTTTTASASTKVTSNTIRSLSVGRAPQQQQQQHRLSSSSPRASRIHHQRSYTLLSHRGPYPSWSRSASAGPAASATSAVGAAAPFDRSISSSSGRGRGRGGNGTRRPLTVPAPPLTEKERDLLLQRFLEPGEWTKDGTDAAAASSSSAPASRSWKLGNGDEIVVEVVQDASSSSPSAGGSGADSGSARTGSPPAGSSNNNDADGSDGDGAGKKPPAESPAQPPANEGEDTPASSNPTDPAAEGKVSDAPRSRGAAAAGGRAGGRRGGGAGADDGGAKGGNGNGNSLQKIDVPKEYPQLLAIPLTRRPLFPGFYKSLYIKDPQVISAIQGLVERRQPYVAVFLAKDDNSELDTITDLNQVHRVGVFAQISNIYPSGPDNSALTVLLYPHRRIRLTEMVKPKRQQPFAESSVVVEEVEAKDATTSSSTEAGPIAPENGEDAAVETVSAEKEGYTHINDHLSEFNVSVVNVENQVDQPYSPETPWIKAITSEMLNVLKEISQINPLVRDQIINFSIQTGGNAFGDPALLADFVAAISSGEPDELQSVLESLVMEERLHKALVVLKKEQANAKLQQEIAKEVDKKINRKQQEYFLMEQLKGIKKELGMDSDGKDKLVEKFKERALKLHMPDTVKKVFDEELNKLQHLEPAASEFNLTRNYLDWLTQIPWGRRSEENFDIPHAMTVLDQDHYGLKDVKDRILEFIAVGKLRGTVEGKIICLVGPPGVGKTSVGRSIARALGREFFRFSVGGLTDVAEIKGHRRTYVGAMPGKVIQALKKVQTENPLIMIDEIDKIGRGHQGDPASALLELLDPEQNNSFLDHYMDVPVDLSKTLFVCTANTLETIPAPLLDRMEVITLSGYVAEEKVAIALKYLAPVARTAAGLDSRNITVTEDAIETLIRQYCRESGVRNLKKHIDKVYRKAALKIVREEAEAAKSAAAAAVAATTDAAEPTVVVGETVPAPPSSSTAAVADDDAASIVSEASTLSAATAVDPAPAPATPATPAPSVVADEPELLINKENLKDYVGSPVYTSDRMYDTTPAGVIMGLAWTSMGGSSLYIESVVDSAVTESSKPSFHRTGQMGDVMKESATIAYTYAKSLLVRTYPSNTFFSHASIHMHVPEGATPKDGPSAGTTMATSLLSLALNRPAIPNVAMTGELTLTGKVLKIGGVKEKTIAAKRSGVQKIIFPAANRPDWDELPDYVKEGLEPTFVTWYEEVFDVVFPGVREEAAKAAAAAVTNAAETPGTDAASA